jgi:hypothetical protein
MGTNKGYAVFLAAWETLVNAATTNATVLPQLEKPRTDLQAKLVEIRTLIGEQGLHQASKQDAGKRVAKAIKEGQQLAAFLRSGIREHFGKESEKVIEFGFAPFRSKRRAPATTPAPPPTPEPPATDDTSGSTTKG